MSTVTAQIEPAERLAELLVEQLTGAGPVHAGGGGARAGGRRHVRRDRPRPGALRPRPALRPVGPDDLGRRSRRPSEARGDRSLPPDFCSLEGKVALVTGGSRGIGAAVCRELGRAGARVAVNYRSSAEAAEEIAGEVGGIAVGGGRRRPGAGGGARRAGRGGARRPRLLVNNAGVTRDTLIARMSDEDWDAVLDTNLRGTFNTCRAVSRKMLRRRAARSST